MKRQRPPLFPPLPPRRVLIRRAIFMTALTVGAIAFLVATLPRWPWPVVMAVGLAYHLAATRLYKWRWDDWPKRGRSENLRSIGLIVPVVGSVILLFWLWPGGFAEKFTAYVIAATVLVSALFIARRVTDWKWLD